MGSQRPARAALSPIEGLNEDDTTRILDNALAGARKEGLRLFKLQRGLVIAGAVTGAVVAGRGIAAVALGSGPAIELAVGLGAALAASAGGLVVGLRMRTKMERLTRDVQSLEAVRAAGTGSPVEIHPYRVAEGVVRPVVVVRTDDAEQVFRKGEAAKEMEPHSWTARATASVILLVAVLVAISLLGHGRGAAKHRWTFVEEAASPDARHFSAGSASSGPWALEAHQAATGARALVNRMGEDDAPAATLVAHGIEARDVRSVTRCRVRADRRGGACGLVFRYTDDATHHVARVDAGSGRIVLSRVRAGTETELGSVGVGAAPDVWYELGVEARGDAIRVSFNGQAVIELRDSGPCTAGKVGLWAPSGTEAFFDELSVEVLAVGPRGLDALPILANGRS